MGKTVRSSKDQKVLKDVALALAEAMKSAKMTQKRLVKKLGISEARISQLINAKCNPTLKTLNHLAGALGCTLKVEFVRFDPRNPGAKIHKITPPRGKRAIPGIYVPAYGATGYAFGGPVV